MKTNKPFVKTFIANSGHTLFVKSVDVQELPSNIRDFGAENYTSFYVVKNWDDDGHIFMYLGKGYTSSPREIVVWYQSGVFRSGFEVSIENAINGAQRDGWMYA